MHILVNEKKFLLHCAYSLLSIFLFFPFAFVLHGYGCCVCFGLFFGGGRSRVGVGTFLLAVGENVSA